MTDKMCKCMRPVFQFSELSAIAKPEFMLAIEKGEKEHRVGKQMILPYVTRLKMLLKDVSDKCGIELDGISEHLEQAETLAQSRKRVGEAVQHINEARKALWMTIMRCP